MKSYFNLMSLVIFTILLMLTACQKEKFDNPTGTENTLIAVTRDKVNIPCNNQHTIYKNATKQAIRVDVRVTVGCKDEEKRSLLYHWDEENETWTFDELSKNGIAEDWSLTVQPGKNIQIACVGEGNGCDYILTLYENQPN